MKNTATSRSLHVNLCVLAAVDKFKEFKMGFVCSGHLYYSVDSSIKGFESSATATTSAF